MDFDKVISRKNTNSMRWDSVEEKYGEPDLIPLTTADMDFEVAAPIKEAVIKAAEQGIWGYTKPRDPYYNAVINRFRKKWDWEIKREWISYSPGVVNAVAYCIQGMTKEGDKIVIPTPMYHPFAHLVEDNARVLAESPMLFDGDRYYIDYAGLEDILSKDAKMLIFCNPHNPAGIAWSYEELKRICELCVKYNIILISDEIHADFVYSGKTFVSMSKPAKELGGEMLERLIVCTSASKSFNLAGLQASDIIIPGRELMKDYSRVLKQQHFMQINLFATVAVEAAYNYGEAWREELLVYLENNRDFTVDYIRQSMRGIKPVIPEATYMIWLDCRELGLDEQQLERLFIHDAKVGVNMGSTFGTGGEGFVRLNFATPRSVLAEALRRISEALNKQDSVYG